MTATTTTLNRRAALGLGVGAAAALMSPPRRSQAQPTGGTVLASSYGFDPNDSTAALQAALDSDADTVIIDNVGQPWITQPLFVNRSNLTVIVEEGVTVQAKSGAFDAINASLLTIRSTTEVLHDIVLSGYGATFQMNKDEYAPMSGEWRMAVRLHSVANVTVEGLTLRESGGDGVYIGATRNPSVPRYCEDITLRDLTVDNHYRNGISVISVKGLVIEGCEITDTVGTNPQRGIDFEPNYADEYLQGIVVRDCYFARNWSFQITVQMIKMRPQSPPISMLFERLTLDDQAGGRPMFVVWANGDDDPGGTIDVNDVVIRNTRTSGSIGVFNKSASGTQVTFRRTVIWNWNSSFVVYPPIIVTAGQPNGSNKTIAYGGIDFDDCLVITDQPGHVFHARGYRPDEEQPDPEPRFTDVHGSLTVVSPNPVTWDYGWSPDNVDLQVSEVNPADDSDPLGASVTIIPCQTVINPGDPVQLQISRTGGLTTAPLAVEYVLEGSATERYDFAGQSGTAIIPAGSNAVTITIATYGHGAGGQVVRTSIVASEFYASEIAPSVVVVRPLR